MDLVSDRTNLFRKEVLKFTLNVPSFGLLQRRNHKHLGLRHRSLKYQQIHRLRLRTQRSAQAEARTRIAQSGIRRTNH